MSWPWQLLLLTLLAEAVIQPSSHTHAICGLGPCRCTRGSLTCDCTGSSIQDMVLEGLSQESFSAISVRNCSRVHVACRALAGLAGLQRVSLSHIARLTLEEHALSWDGDGDPRHTGLLVNITDSRVPTIPSYCLQGDLREVLLSGVAVDTVQAFAFSAIRHAERLTLHRLTAAHVEPQSFKKCSVDVLSVSESRFGVLHSRTMVDLEVHQEVAFSDLTVDTVEYLGFKIHGPKSFRVVRSRIGHLGRHAFHVHTRGPVLIHDNEFSLVERSAFAGLSVERRFAQVYGQQELVFQNNSLDEVESGGMTFNTTGLSARLDRVLLRQPCSCAGAARWAQDLVFLSSSSLERATSPPQVDTVLYCLQGPSGGGTAVAVARYRRLHCLPRGSRLPLALALVAAAVAALSALAALLYCLHGRRARSYATVPHSPSPSPLKARGPVLVVPDGKVYRETELHVIVEQVTPIAPPPRPDHVTT